MRFLKKKKKRFSSFKIDIDPEKLPSHIAIIMDGNGRWASRRLLNRVRGHEKGAETVRAVVRTCREIGIKFLTLYAFSTENWARPQKEVSALMSLLKRFLESETPTMIENDISLRIIGQENLFSKNVRDVLETAVSSTIGKKKMTLTLALSYGGRSEITEAVRKIAEKAAKGVIEPEHISEKTVSDHLYTYGISDPDILIRTGGDLRISNFMLWQLSYTELFFTKTLWPDFTKEELISIIKEFQSRERRYGKI